MKILTNKKLQEIIDAILKESLEYGKLAFERPKDEQTDCMIGTARGLFKACEIIKRKLK